MIALAAEMRNSAAPPPAAPAINPIELVALPDETRLDGAGEPTLEGAVAIVDDGCVKTCQ